jgi:hypothetical protein
LTIGASLSRRNEKVKFNIHAFHAKGELFAFRVLRAAVVGRSAVMWRNLSSLHIEDFKNAYPFTASPYVGDHDRRTRSITQRRAGSLDSDACLELGTAVAMSSHGFSAGIQQDVAR